MNTSNSFLFTVLFMSLCCSMQIGVPAYFYPTHPGQGAWLQVESAAVAFVIMDPDNGPGIKIDPNYQQQIADTKQYGLKVFGYVTSNYAARNLSQVTGDIDTWYSFYSGLDGIFVDLVSSACANVSYYFAVKTHIQSYNGTVILNPGNVVPECFSNCSNILLTFENNANQYASWTSGGWEYKYPILVYHVLHNALLSHLETYLQLAQQRNVSYIYITDGNGQYSRLPTFWANETAMVTSLNA